MTLTRRLAAALAALASGPMLWTSSAQAQGAGEAVAVVVEGPDADADAVTGWLEDRVRAPDTLHDGEALRIALRSHGALPLRAGASGGSRDAQLVARARAA